MITVHVYIHVPAVVGFKECNHILQCYTCILHGNAPAILY